MTYLFGLHSLVMSVRLGMIMGGLTNLWSLNWVKMRLLLYALSVCFSKLFFVNLLKRKRL